MRLRVRTVLLLGMQVLGCGAAAWAFADLKGRSGWKWGLAGLLCNILGVAAAAIAPDLTKKRERENRGVLQ